MTGNSPKIWAAADLDPISPAPVYPPSPIVVPTLQNQADTYFTMSLNGSSQMASAANTIAEQPKVDEHFSTPATNTHDDTLNGAHNAGAVALHIAAPDRTVNGAARGAETVLVGVSAEENMQAAETSQLDATEAKKDVLNLNESIHNYDTSAPTSGQVDVAAPSHNSPTNPSPSELEPSSDPYPRSIFQPDYKLPEEGQVASSAADAQPSQSPTDHVSANNDHRLSASHISHQAIDIQALVDNITARAAAADTSQESAFQGTSSGDAHPQNTILPPKPPVPQQMSTLSYPRREEYASYPSVASQISNVPSPLSNAPTSSTYAVATPGTFDSYASAINIPPVNPESNLAIPNLPSDSTYAAMTVNQPHSFDQQKKRWDTFQQEERKYVSEAKWDRFPDGSRIFIGNLSSERVSKKEVFDIFSKFGRLAQISLKQAYGFVQYHTVAEGQAAMDNLQGIEIRGRKINLEFSRQQKKEGEGNNRGNRGKRESDRHENNRARRDDYRPSRQPSPRRGNHRQQPSIDSNHNRGRGYHESNTSNRRRSQSPSYGSRDPYRHRSPSPYHPHPAATDLDLPRRYGAEIPDVQFLLLQDVERDFVSWAQRAFTAQGLRVDVMFLNPQFPRDAVIQRQVLEGVHAVAELDFRAQQLGKIPLQVFDRSAGYNNVRYDQYQDLDPPIAAQLVSRAKSQSQLPSTYGGSQFAPAQQYPPAQGHYMPPYSNQAYPSPIALNAGGGHLDPATIHKILGSVNGQQGSHGSQTYMPPSGGAPVDVNTLLATLGAAPKGQPPMGGPPAHHGMGYTHPPPPSAHSGAPHTGESARHVQDIMTQLARYRQ
ncbi:hypothetical protein F5Y19DRAFT_183569 [Xylariaceae sp. FL1651]|nr:hypothetical protein F5Y19DRAFT_183569 [Xylariaceae sp. FL1651]